MNTQANRFLHIRLRTLLLCGITGFFCVGCSFNPDYLIRQGIKYLPKDPYTAASFFKTAVLMQKDNPSAHYNLGVAYWKQGRKEQAIESFRWASELIPDDPRPLEFLAWIYSEMGEWKKAHKAMLDACRRQPLTPRLHTQMARIEYHIGNLDGARVFLEEALALDPSFAPAIYNMAVLSQAYPTAIRYQDSIKYYKLYLNTVQTISKNKTINVADKKYIAKAQKSIDMLTNSVHGLLPVPTTQVHKKSNLWSSKPTAEIPPNSYDGANKLSDYKVSRDSLWNLACFYKNNPEQTANAISAYKKFTEMFPDDARCKKAKKAINELTKPSITHQNVSNILTNKQSKNEMKFDKNAALKFWSEGLAHHRTGNLDHAIVLYKQALNSDPECIDASYNLGIAYRTKKMYNEALHMLLLTLQHKPNMVEASYMLGLVYKDIGEKEKAIKQMITTLTLEPKHVMAHYVLGRLYLEQNNPTIAMIHLETHLRMSPPDTQSAKDTERLLAILKQNNVKVHHE